MSTYGIALIADVPDAAAGEQLAQQILATLRKDWPGESTPVDDVAYEVAETDAGARLELNGPDVVANRREEEFFAGAGQGRAVLCEDGDEYGVTFQVWKLTPSGSELLYRAYVPYDDEDADPATAARAVTGPDAAEAVANLYGVDADFLLALEEDPSPVQDELGVIGTPFMPWLGPLALRWPQPW